MGSSVQPPTGGVARGFSGNLKSDAVAGFLVCLVAMPLCLAVATASGFPPIAGIWTAVIGGVLTPLVGSSQLTVKGPAVGLIAVVLGAVTDLGAEVGRAEGLPEAAWPWLGYKLTLGIGVSAGVVQVLLGLLGVGRLVDVFPLTPVHGALASIGIVVIVRQTYEVVGVCPTTSAGPLALLTEFPRKLSGFDPVVALIGLSGLLILFGLPVLARRVPPFRRVPGPFAVLLVAALLGAGFDLKRQYTCLFPNFFSDLGPRFLADMPKVLADPASAFALPDFRGLATATGVRYLLLFCLIGSLETLVTARAVDLFDPWRRKTRFDRDLLAVGLANAVTATLGGLPMTSEIDRSRANIDSGAKTRAAGVVHGLCLLAFVLAFPNLLHHIPLAALGAVLVFTGFRLASPREFARTYRLGSEQFLVFVGTIAASLATGLLAGVAVGIVLEVLFRRRHVPVTGLLKTDIGVLPEGDDLVVLVVKRAAVFGNWHGVREAIRSQGEGRREVVIDLSQTRLLGPGVTDRLNELVAEFRAAGKRLKLLGLDEQQTPSRPPPSDRKRSGGVTVEPSQVA